MDRVTIAVLLLALVLLVQRTVAVAPYDVLGEIDFCATDTAYFFDTTSLECLVCGDNQIYNEDTAACECEVGWLYVEQVGAADTNGAVAPNDIFLCEETCAISGLPTWSDSLSCASCDASTSVFDPATLDCACLSSNSKISEYDASGQRRSQKVCLVCPQNTVLNPSDAYECVECPDINMELNDNQECVCADGYTEHSNTCLQSSFADTILTQFSPATAAGVTFSIVTDSDSNSEYSVSFTSAIVEDIYLSAAVGCYVQAYREDCHALLNLCAASLYDTDNTICEVLEFIQDSRSASEEVHEYPNWQRALPHKQYVDDKVLDSLSLLSQVYFRLNIDAPEDRSQIVELKFMLVSYDLYGNYLGMETLTDQLQFCDESDASRWRLMGTAYDNRCTYSLRKMLHLDEEEEPDQLFYELYYVDKDDAFFPVPIKVLNFIDENGNEPNRGDNGQEWFSKGNLQLHRRFFLSDITTGKKALTDTADTITYAQSIVLRVEMQPDSTDKILPPVLSITYAQRKTNVILQGGTPAYAALEFRVEYHDSDQSIEDVKIAFFVIAMIAALLIAAGRMYISTKTNKIVNVDLSFILRLLLFCYSALADTFFWMIFCVDFYCFTFYKGQQTVFFLMPVRGSYLYTEHTDYIIVAFVGKALDLVYRLWSQIYSDVFFVDWEKPKNERRNESGSGESKDHGGVSVWRKLMVVNIWNDLQVERYIDIHFSVFAILFLLFGAGLENMATEQPDLENLEDDAAPLNPVLRFCVSTLCWLIVGGGQLLFQKFVYQPYMTHKAGQFVDLCNLTNISAFIFDERYRCYYIHGESVSKHADVSLDQIFENLKAYQNSATQSRGLDGTGHDTFVMYASKALRSKYDSEYSELLARQTLQRQHVQRAGNGGFSRREEMKRRIRERKMPTIHRDDDVDGISRGLINANHSLNSFLKSFISNHDNQHPRSIEERGYLETSLNIPPATRTNDTKTSVLFKDEAMSFVNATLMGIEYEIVIFYALLHGICDLIWANTVVSLLVVYIIDRIIVFSRAHWGKINLSKKTLVDYRFLI